MNLRCLVVVDELDVVEEEVDERPQPVERLPRRAPAGVEGGVHAAGLARFEELERELRLEERLAPRERHAAP